MRKSAQINSANGGRHAVLEDTLHGGVNVTLECAP